MFGKFIFLCKKKTKPIPPWSCVFDRMQSSWTEMIAWAQNTIHTYRVCWGCNKICRNATKRHEDALTSVLWNWKITLVPPNQKTISYRLLRSCHPLLLHETLGIWPDCKNSYEITVSFPLEFLTKNDRVVCVLMLKNTQIPYFLE